MTSDESYLSGLNRNMDRLNTKLPRLMDGSKERANCLAHISGLQKEISKVTARIAAALPGGIAATGDGAAAPPAPGQ